MAYNKVIKKDGTVLLDLTNNMVVAETLGKNITAIDKHGNKITGTLTDSPIPIEVSTEEEMTTLLETGESGSIYKYVGENGTYENGTLYILEGTQETDPLIGTWVLNQSNLVGLPSEICYGSDMDVDGYMYKDDEIISYKYEYIDIYTDKLRLGSGYDDTLIDFDPDYPNIMVVYERTAQRYNDTIIRQQLSTFTINSYPTDNTNYFNTLLNFLQANATKQPSRTFEKLVVPTGTLDITTNGEYDVSNYVKANVNIINTLQSKIDNNGDTPSCKGLFYKWQGTDPTLLLTSVDTSKVTDMSRMFYYCTNLTTIPLFDTSNVTNMEAMFVECTNLTTIPLFDTSNVTNMSEMLCVCESLTSIPLFDTSNVTNMDAMIAGCINLTTIPQLDTSKVTSMYLMFHNCTNLTSIPLLDTSNVTNMSWMFADCTNLTTIPQLDTSNVTNMELMFYGCTNLTTIPPLDVSKVENMDFMLDYCTNLTSVTFINMENTTADYGGIFLGCTNLKSLIMSGATRTFVIRDSTQFETQDLVNLIDSLGTSTATGMRRPILHMGEVNLAKLTDEQKAVAYAKGWQLM